MYPYKNVDGAMHFIYSYKYNINSAEDSSDMTVVPFIDAPTFVNILLLLLLLLIEYHSAHNLYVFALAGA